MTYANGQIPLSALTAVPGNGTIGNSTTQYLVSGAAADFLRMKKAYDAQPGTGLLTITEGYRSLAKQTSLYALYRAGKGNLAAQPGTSNHGLGVAADFGAPITSQNTVGHAWLRANAAKYNWVWEGKNFSRVEPWHWKWVGNSSVASAAATPTARALFYGSANAENYKKAVQQELKNQDLYAGAVDGDFGKNSITGLQKYIVNVKKKSVGSAGIDGQDGDGTRGGVQDVAATAPGKYTGGKDYKCGMSTWDNFLIVIRADNAAKAKAEAAAKAAAATPKFALFFGSADNKTTKANVQQGLKDAGFYKGEIDSDWQSGSVKALQNFVIADGGSVGSTGADGDPGLNTCKGVQQIAAKGGYKGDKDNLCGVDTWKFFLIELNRYIKAKKPTTTTPPVTTTPPATTVPAAPLNLKYGIDVAWPQTGKFDTAKIASMLQFAFAKASGAENRTAPYIYGPADLLDAHLTWIRKAGIPAGFYHFNNGSLSINDQINIFVSTVTSRIKKGDLLALDVEDGGTDSKGTKYPEFTPDQALIWLQGVEKAFGVKPFVYINRSTMNNNDWSKVVAAGYPLWLATLDGEVKDETVKYWKQWTINQYKVGTTAGYNAGSGQVDLDAARSNVFDYAFKSMPVSTAPTTPSNGSTAPAVEVVPKKDYDALKQQYNAVIQGVKSFANGLKEI